MHEDLSALLRSGDSTAASLENVNFYKFINGVAGNPQAEMILEDPAISYRQPIPASGLP